MHLDSDRESYARFRTRIELEDKIEELIAVLDMLDDDPDVEGASEFYFPDGRVVRISDDHEPDDDGEHSLGWGPDAAHQRQLHTSDELELDPGDGEPERSDYEPSLGSMGIHWPQTAWASGGTDEREQDAGDEGEPDVDGEPELGATNDVNQEDAWRKPDAGFSSDGEPSLGWTFTGALGNTDDCEGDEHDGSEPDEDGEPSLGSLEIVHQVGWANSDRSDLEGEHDGREPEEGVA